MHRRDRGERCLSSWNPKKENGGSNTNKNPFAVLNEKSAERRKTGMTEAEIKANWEAEKKQIEMRGDAISGNVSEQKGEGNTGMPANDAGNNPTPAAQAPTAAANNGGFHEASKEEKVGLSGGVSFGNLDTKVRDRGESAADRGATVTPSTSLPKPANLFGGTSSGGPTAATASAMNPPSYA